MVKVKEPIELIPCTTLVFFIFGVFLSAFELCIVYPVFSLTTVTLYII